MKPTKRAAERAVVRAAMRWFKESANPVFSDNYLKAAAKRVLPADYFLWKACARLAARRAKLRRKK